MWSDGKLVNYKIVILKGYHYKFTVIFLDNDDVVMEEVINIYTTPVYTTCRAASKNVIAKLRCLL